MSQPFRLAARKLGGNGAVLVLLDADDDCAAALGPELLQRARDKRPDLPLSVVLAVKEFEACREVERLLRATVE